MLRSHVTLEIAGGATLKCSTNREFYRRYGSLIFAENAEDVGVTGSGTIEGNGTAYFPTLKEGAYEVPHAFLGPWNPLDESPGQFHADGRPRMIILVACRHARLQGFRIHDAPTWTIHPIGCEDLLIQGLAIDNNLLIPNNDGIDVDRCKRVRVSDCAITAGDDCLIVKTSRNFPQFGDCSDVVMSNCTLRSSSAGVKVEPEGPGRLHDCIFRGLTITDSNRGLAIFNRDGAVVERLVFSDLIITTRLHHDMWWGKAEPINVSNLPRRASIGPCVMRDLRFDNIVCQGESGVFIHGWPGSTLERLTFSNLQVRIEKTSAFSGGVYDLRPNEYPGYGVYPHRIAGLYAEEVDGLTLDDVTVTWGPSPPGYFGPAIETHDVRDLVLENVRGAAAHPGQPAQVHEPA
ncbi:MAG: hypothetical protein INR64_10685 [Caulobacteraceae bacterium]|nr:hypothetical protein [Caulobacter sp.]